MPSKKSVGAARHQLKVLLGINRYNRMQFKIISIGYDEVTFSYGGYKIHFSIRDGLLTREGTDHIYLQEDDYRLLFLLAKQILDARKRHIKNKIAQKKLPAEIESKQATFSF